MTITLNGTTGITSPGGDTSTSLTTSGLTIGTTPIGAGNATRFKNRIINGDMRIDQRNAGASVTPTDAQYLVDRFVYRGSQTGKYTAQQNAGSVTPPEGFTNYLGLTSTSAFTPASTDYFQLKQIIEGFNIADLGWGTANAKTVTLSFWVRSSLTGQFGGSIRNNPAFTYVYPFSYTVSSANTWTKISITIVGPNASQGVWNTNNTAGLEVVFDLGCGSTFLSTSGSWQSGGFAGVTGDTKVVSTSGATFYVTGVQLEVGESATGFEYVDYGTQLAMCQRYYEISSAGEFSAIAIYTPQGQFMCAPVSFQTTKRATPTFTNVSVGGAWAAPGSFLVSGSTSSFSLRNATVNTFSLQNTRVAGNTTPTNGNAYVFEGAINVAFSAEL